MKQTILIASATLFLGLTACNNTPATKENPNATAPVVAEGGLKIAYVDTDTLLAHYQYAKDLEADLLAFKNQQEATGRKQMETFQKDYQDYLKNGSTMTLTQQQAKEAELKQRAERMATLEQELTAKIMERQMTENTKLLNAIFAYVREYNEQNQQFDVILRKTFENTPVLYINPAMDITQEILEGLNAEYAQVKGKK